MSEYEAPQPASSRHRASSEREHTARHAPAGSQPVDRDEIGGC
ncbi:MAG: hypothetical protein ACSLFR_05200 [Solirubrobacteraceae bacterium]